MSRRFGIEASILLGAAFLVFGFALPNPFYFDDLYVLRDNAWLHGFRAPGLWFTSLFVDSNHLFDGYRPSLMLSFFANAKLLGTDPWAFRLGNLLLHAINAILMLRVVRSLGPRMETGCVPLAAALLFLLHPEQSLGINFLWKRSSLLEATWILSSLFLHIRERNRGTYRVRIFLGQLLLYFMAMTTKESGGFLPVYLACADVLLFGWKTPFGSGRSRALYLGLGVLAAGFLWFRLGFLPEQLARIRELLPDRRLVSRGTYFLTNLNVLPRYFGLWLAPRPLILDDPSFVTSFPWVGAFLTAGMLSGGALLSWRFRKEPAVALGVALFWVGQLATLGWVPMYLVMDQIRLYSSLAGLSLLLAVGVHALAGKLRWNPWSLLVPILVVYAAGAGVENAVFRSPTFVWTNVTERYPGSGLAWQYLGAALEEDRRLPEAAAAYEKATEAEPQNHGFRVGKLLTWQRLGASRETIRKELDLLPFDRMNVRDVINAAIVYANLGENQRGERLLLDAAVHSPDYLLVHLNLGVLWEGMGRLEDARRAYANVLKLSPGHAQATQALARLGPPSSRLMK